MTFMGTLRRTVRLRQRPLPRGTLVPAPPSGSAAPADERVATSGFEISPNDPLSAYLQAAPGVVDVDRLDLASAALSELRGAGVKVVVPLVTQGELIGALYLGPRLSDQDYSTDDRRLLATLAAQAAPAIRVAQLVEEQAAEVAARERIEQELRVATLIQQQFLPRVLPDLPNWQVAAYYGPARAVGGDFYDFIELPDGRIGIVVGDVTDKGVPAALVMARTHSILRGEAPRLISPGQVLERANELLVDEMPERMFVTCLYVVLEPSTGRVVYANAGHNLPYVRTADDRVIELRATGMPLGLLPGMRYEECEATIAPGENVLLYSDGMVEAHSPQGEMYGFPRLRSALEGRLAGSELIDGLLDGLHGFVGRAWEQEDDITMVTIRRSPAAAMPNVDAPGDEPGGRILLELSLPGAIGNERVAMDRVAEAVAGIGLDPARLEQLRTAVSETAMNAIEYGSASSPDVPVEIVVRLAGRDLVVSITDRALGGRIHETEEPDLDAKLAGLQKPRGWGLFLIRHMVDDVAVTSDDDSQTVTLTIHLEDALDGRDTAHG
ncbi:MAG TPA: SpoIIE family protein phosphatase [Candidatus Limnocylindrales bacterium]|nr:SpoIIE family protein phosphatase [Candidatus Limnocylindrales bacterium]